MAKQIDVYRDWLGIQEPTRPLSYYQLLRLKSFEDDPAKIREHYRKMNGHVRKFAAGDYAQQSQELLNELAKAMLCLTDARRKAEYDASHGRSKAADGQRRTLEEILLSRQVIDAAQLAKARNYANAVGVELRDALLQQKIAKAEVVMPAYAESIGLPYLDLGDIQIDSDLAARVPAVLARQHSCAPVMVDDNQLLMASPNVLDPNVEEELRLRLGLSVRTVLCTAAAIHDVVAQHYSREAAIAEAAAAAAPKTAATAAKLGKAAAAPTAKPAKAAAAPQAAAPAEKPAAKPVETAETKRNRAKIALITFNFTGMALFFAIQFELIRLGLFTGLAVSLAVGAAAAGIVWSALKATGK